MYHTVVGFTVLPCVSDVVNNDIVKRVMRIYFMHVTTTIMTRRYRAMMMVTQFDHFHHKNVHY